MDKNEEKYYRLIYSTQDQYMEQWLAGYYTSERDDKKANKNCPDYKTWLEDHRSSTDAKIRRAHV